MAMNGFGLGRHVPGLLIALLLVACNKQSTTFPEVRDLTVSVYAPGVLIDPDEYLVHAPASGILQDWQVKEGDTVEAGAALVVLESSNSELNRQNARIRMDEIRKNLREGSSFRQELNFNVRQTELKYRDDSSNFAKQKRLWDQGIGSERDFSARKLALDISREQYDGAIQRRKTQLQQLRTELETAQNMLLIADNQQKDFVVKSKIRGVLSERLLNEGEWVMPQQPVGRISGIGAYRLELDVDEVDIVRIEPGQFAAIALDAYPDKVFPGKVSYINKQKTPLTQSYKIEVVFEEKPEKWFVGMTAEANIVIEERENALLIPQEYLLGDNRVITENGDTLRLQIGASDFEYCEVLSGIDPKTAIQKPRR